MKMWVVMGNDYPAAICSSGAIAQRRIIELKASKDRIYGESAVIYWRAYDFEVDEN